MAPFNLSEQQRFDWLRLIRTEGVGPRTFRSLVNRFGGAGAALEALPELARGAGRAVSPPPPVEIERELEQARRLGVRFVAMGEGAYPVALAASQTAPPLIAVRGRLEALARPMVSIVGSRNASGMGMKFTEKLARELGEAGFVIVSGLARGIDTAAHRASLETGTVAVLAGGHGQVYPPQNEPLLEQLIERGAAISEMAFTQEPRARDFPRRNRIVAGLALGVVVVEAARKSGSLITARLALEEGRELFAVPGSPLDPRAEGANDLLRKREAHLCRSAEDVIEELRPQIGGESRLALFESPLDRTADDGLDELDWLLPGSARTLSLLPETGMAGPWRGAGEQDAPKAHEFGMHESGTHEPDEPAARLRSLIGPVAITTDDLVRHSGMSARDVQGALVEMEMQGLVRRDPAGAYVLL